MQTSIENIGFALRALGDSLFGWAARGFLQERRMGLFYKEVVSQTAQATCAKTEILQAKKPGNLHVAWVSLHHRYCAKESTLEHPCLEMQSFASLPATK